MSAAASHLFCSKPVPKPAEVMESLHVEFTGLWIRSLAWVSVLKGGDGKGRGCSCVLSLFILPFSFNDLLACSSTFTSAHTPPLVCAHKAEGILVVIMTPSSLFLPNFLFLLTSPFHPPDILVVSHQFLLSSPHPQRPLVRLLLILFSCWVPAGTLILVTVSSKWDHLKEGNEERKSAGLPTANGCIKSNLQFLNRHHGDQEVGYKEQWP